MKSPTINGTLKPMTSEQWLGVLRAYLKKRTDEYASLREFYRQTGIPHSQVSTANSNDTGVSWGMLLKIAQTIGPPMNEILLELSRMCAQIREQQLLGDTADVSPHRMTGSKTVTSFADPENAKVASSELAQARADEKKARARALKLSHEPSIPPPSTPRRPPSREKRKHHS